MCWLDDVERHRAARFIREEIDSATCWLMQGSERCWADTLEINPEAVALDRSATGKPFLTKSAKRSVCHNVQFVPCPWPRAHCGLTDAGGRSRS